MRSWTSFVSLFGALSLLVACSSDDSLGVKADRQTGTGGASGESKCDGPDPSTLSCANGCASGTVCDPEACFPSSCSCDKGEWQCTLDCGLGACVPAPACEGPDPSLGCDGGCPTGTECDTTACRPSLCSCDGASGSWQCTMDCGEGGACVAP